KCFVYRHFLSLNILCIKVYSPPQLQKLITDNRLMQHYKGIPEVQKVCAELIAEPLHSSQSSHKEYYNQLSHAELRDELRKHGLPNLPITETTRNLLLKKLKNHLLSEPLELTQAPRYAPVVTSHANHQY
uniref:LEM domain-containing protein n=1 Tax=Glossina palpalis gambiensis TaxID=67801 RepID=A0A1B0C0P7_9MUSC